MYVVDVGFKGKKFESMRQTTNGNGFFSGLLYLTGEDSATIFGDPDEVIRDLVVAPARLSVLQGMVHGISIGACPTLRKQFALFLSRSPEGGWTWLAVGRWNPPRCGCVVEMLGRRL